MRINELQQSNTVASGNVFAIDTSNGTFKIDYDVLAAAIINKLGGDPVTVAHGGTGSSSASGARTNLSVYSKTETDSAIQQSTATRFGSNSASSFDDLITAGIFSVSIPTTGNRPVSNIGSYAVIVISSSLSSTAGSAITQIAIPTGSNNPNSIYIRNKSSAGVWSNWYNVSTTVVS